MINNSQEIIKFSIVITTYNRCQLVKRAINSALQQTINCEVIVIDDCSSDQTEIELKIYQNQIIYVRNKINKGHSESVNLGVSLAQGNWIKLLDDDDYLTSDCLAELLSQIRLNPSVVISSCQAFKVNERGKKIKKTKRVGNQINYLVKQEDIHYLMLIDQLPFGTPVQVAFEKDAFLRSGGWSNDFNLIYDDIESWVKIAQFGDAIFVNKTLVYRTIWNQGINSKFSFKSKLDYNILIKKKIYNLVHNKYKNTVPTLADIIDYLHLYWAIIALKDKNMATFFELIFPVLFKVNPWRIYVKLLIDRIRS